MAEIEFLPDFGVANARPDRSRSPRHEEQAPPAAFPAFPAEGVARSESGDSSSSPSGSSSGGEELQTASSVSARLASVFGSEINSDYRRRTGQEDTQKGTLTFQRGLWRPVSLKKGCYQFSLPPSADDETRNAVKTAIISCHRAVGCVLLVKIDSWALVHTLRIVPQLPRDEAMMEVHTCSGLSARVPFSKAMNGDGKDDLKAFLESGIQHMVPLYGPAIFIEILDSGLSRSDTVAEILGLKKPQELCRLVKGSNVPALGFVAGAYVSPEDGVQLVISTFRYAETGVPPDRMNIPSSFQDRDVQRIFDYRGHNRATIKWISNAVQPRGAISMDGTGLEIRFGPKEYKEFKDKVPEDKRYLIAVGASVDAKILVDISKPGRYCSSVVSMRLRESNR